MDVTDKRSLRKATGFRAFQSLCVDLRSGTKGYFYRANSPAELYQKYTTEEYWERIAKRDKWYWQQDHSQEIRRQAT